MQYGINPLSIVAVRNEPCDTSEMVTQLLYGEVFKIIDNKKKWVKIRIAFDNYEGWIDIKQLQDISKESYENLSKWPQSISNQIIDSNISGCDILEHRYEGEIKQLSFNKKQIIPTAFNFLNSPYLWGGKNPLGIDCSGFTQLVYKLNGFKLLRDASQQATQGDPLSFIEESEPGDLAFFDNEEGDIIHVGIIMEDNYIIHAHGQVRIDRIDHSGIYNVTKKTHTHKLRVIKKIL
jgi:hypothetical protein